MAGFNVPKGKIVRRFGENIFGSPKYDKLLKHKPNGPGKDRGVNKRRKISDYGLQLNEKQKFRFSYGLSETQFRNLYLKARKSSGDTENKLIELLECRFDNVVYRMGWASTRAQARQMINHKHFLVNGKCLNIPSAKINPGDILSIKEHKGIRELARNNLSGAGSVSSVWLESDNDSLTGKMTAKPDRAASAPVGKTQLVVEYYSRR